MKNILKKIIPSRIIKSRRQVLNALSLIERTRSLTERACPICGFFGKFNEFGHPPRLDAQCPNCGSLERHRQFYLAYSRGLFTTTGEIPQPILHFAAEAEIEKFFRSKNIEYITADLFQSADIKLNIEKIDCDEKSFGTVIANHVLEHVDDFLACSEIYRVLSDGGIFICSVPIIEGWDETYENNNAKSERDRVIHFGQWDHVRYYGRDFRDRVRKAGFHLEAEITAKGDDVVKYGLLRGEKIFVFRKQAK